MSIAPHLVLVMPELMQPDPLVHYGCCRQTHTAICGSPLNGSITSKPVDCIVCEDTHEHNGLGYCPLDGSKCP